MKDEANVAKREISNQYQVVNNVVAPTHSGSTLAEKIFQKIQSKVAEIRGNGKVKVTILGCSGGIGSSDGIGLRTTSLLIDDDILIDAGTGVGDLSVDALVSINHIFITHTHLDHIACLPLLLDTVMGMRPHPVIVHATADVVEILKAHIFNWKIWPDFNQIPDKNSPFLLYDVIEVGKPVEMGRRRITALPANHVVPAVGYQIDSGQHSLVFTGDTTTCDALWKQVNQIPNLNYLIIETAFSNAELELAKVSKHLCPLLLAEELLKLNHKAELYITHLKPGEGEIIMQEIERDIKQYKAKPLANQQIFKL